MALPTTRRMGLGGTATIGATGSVYDGIDCTNVSVKATQAVTDAHTKSDAFEVSQLGRKGATITIGKMVSSAAFCKSSLLGTTLALVVTSGDGTEVAGDGGETIFTGNVVVTSVGYESPDGMEAENLECKATGSFTLADAVSGGGGS